MWSSIAKWAVKIAVWAIGHKDEVIAIVDAVAEAKKKKSDA